MTSNNYAHRLYKDFSPTFFVYIKSLKIILIIEYKKYVLVHSITEIKISSARNASDVFIWRFQQCCWYSKWNIGCFGILQGWSRTPNGWS